MTAQSLQIDLYDDSPLGKSPKVTAIEKVGGLPPNVRARARAIKRENPEWSLSRCIATAIDANKYSTETGGDLKFKGRQQEGAAAQSRHATANAEWESKKARMRSKRKGRKINMATTERNDLKKKKGKKKGSKAAGVTNKAKLKAAIKDFKGRSNDLKGKEAARLKSSQQRLGMKVGLSDSVFSEPGTVDLAEKVFFKNRRTPEIVSDGATPKKGGAGTKAGAVLKRKPVTKKDKKKMKGGKWLREDKDGKTPGQSGYLSGPSKGPDAKKKKKKKISLSDTTLNTVLLSEGLGDSHGDNPLGDSISLASPVVGSTVARITTFNPGKHSRGIGGRFATKGKTKGQTTDISGKVNSLAVGESIELPGGAKGFIKRIDRGYQVVKGDGSYNKVFRNATDALGEAQKMIRSSYGKGDTKK